MIVSRNNPIVFGKNVVCDRMTFFQGGKYPPIYMHIHSNKELDFFKVGWSVICFTDDCLTKDLGILVKCPPWGSF